MENFIFSVNCTLPIFAVMVIGIIGRRLGLLNDEYVAKANKFNFYTAMPAMLFMNMYGQDIRGSFNAHTFIIVGSCIIAMFVLAMLAARFLVKDKYMRGAFAQGAFRGNTALVGISLIMNMYGESVIAAGVVACVVPLYNIGAVIFLSVFAAKGETKRKSVGSVIKSIITNPLIIGTVLGTIAALTGLKLPTAAERTLGYMSDMAMGTALICIGAGMRFSALRRCLKPALLATVFKLVIFPLLFVPVAYHAGYRMDALMAIFIAVGSPAAVNSYTMAQSMNHDADLASGIVVISTLLGSVTMTLWVFVLRNMGLV